MKEMILPKNVLYIISKLNSEGYRADVVGGCVRDHILGKEPGDYDITTSATPDEMKSVFSDLRTVETGIKHGTLTVVIDSVPYEVTTYRLDGEYTDNRHPDKVSFTRHLADDLSRRDFTVNAMCYNPMDGFTDLFSGLSDIDLGVIRTVGDPLQRFSEDALRIMRALRFASTLGFKIDPDTSSAIFNLAHLLKNVSSERILVEWRKLLSGVSAYRIIKEYSSVIAEAIPSLKNAVLGDENAFLSADGALRELALFLNTYGDRAGDEYFSAMSALKSDNKTKDYGKAVLSGSFEKTESRTDINLLLVKYGADVARGITELKIMLGKATEKERELLSKMLSEKVCYRICDLALRGDDIISLGYRGKDVGRILAALLDRVARGKVKNERETLLSEVAKIS